MTNEWSLRNEIFLATHRWPIIVLSILAGSLLGWIVSLVWPSTHQATVELYVGLNPAEVLQEQSVSQASNVQFIYINDFKNWQMADLNALIFMDWITKETLNRLQKEDSYWSNISQEELSGMLRAYWRNAGRWRLVAENKDTDHAAQAVNAWQNVVVEQVQAAIRESRNLSELDTQKQSIADAKAQTIANAAQLAQIHLYLQTWRDRALQEPADHPVEETERLQLLASLSQADLGEAGKQLVDTFPASGASTQAYIPWSDQAITWLGQEIQIAQAHVAALDTQLNSLNSQFSDALSRSRGLSANLSVEKMSDSPPKRSIVQPTGLFILVGGILGLIAWIIAWLAGISLRARR